MISKNLTIPTFKDFTPVCTTEIISFARANESLKKMNTYLIGLSVDSNSSHLAWLYDIYCRTGIKVPFPIIADRSGEIARKYGMLSNESSNTETVRNVYIIDDNGIIRTILIYPLNIGRFIPEIVRIIQALQLSDSSEKYVPANWIPGQPTILPPPKTFNKLIERKVEIEKNKSGLNWYLGFTGIPLPEK